MAEPFERGFGTTVGNSLRRILLSSLEGSSITQVKIQGIQHEFTTIPGVKEDVTDLILNIKDLVLTCSAEEPVTLRLDARGPGEVTAAPGIDESSVRRRLLPRVWPKPGSSGAIVNCWRLPSASPASTWGRWMMSMGASPLIW